MHAYEVFANEGLHCTSYTACLLKLIYMMLRLQPLSPLRNPFQLYLRYTSSLLRDINYVVDIACLHFAVSS